MGQPEELRGRWGVLPEDPGIEVCGVGRAVEQMLRIMWALPAVRAAVLVEVRIYPVQVLL